MTSPVWGDVFQAIGRFRADIRDLRVTPPPGARDLRAALEARYPFDQPVPLESVTRDVIDLLTTDVVQVTHPRYFGLFNPTVREAGIVGETLAALFNPQLAAWSHAPAANEIERHTLRALARAVGFGDPTSLAAFFATGGAEANLAAVLAALAASFPEAAEHGLAALRARPAIYITAETHHSFVKIARMTGLGTAALRTVPLDHGFRLDPDALEARLDADAAAGWAPLLIVGTAGTTSAGLIDPLPRLADIAGRRGVWLHVDAAWGATAALSPRLRPALQGIERADSLTWDAHKWLSVPMGAGMFFCRHPQTVSHAFSALASYMPGPVGPDTPDPFNTTPQWSRRAIGLKVFMALAELGFDGYARLVEHQARMGDLLRERLRAAGWWVVNETPLPVVCFTHDSLRSGRITEETMLQRLYARGRVWISSVVLGGQQHALRACVTSYETTPSDLDVLLAELEQARRSPA